MKRVLFVSIIGLAGTAEGQVFGTNTGTFTDWLQSYPTDIVPFRPPGQYGSGYNAATPGTTLGGSTNPVIIGNASIWSNASNYENGLYKVEFDAPNPNAIGVLPSGMFSSLQNVSVNGTHYTGYFNLQHDNGDLLAGGGQINFSNASSSNPISNIKVTRPGGSNNLTPQFQSLLNNYQAVRWMNNLNINNNSSVVTSADLPSAGQEFTVNSYHDIISWSNAQSNLKKVWINIPINANDTFIKGVADDFAANLAPGKQVVVELGNENWNFAFSHPASILTAARSDPRVTSTDDFGKTGEEAGLMAAHMMQVFRNEFSDKSRVEGFLGSQGANTYFVDKSKQAINSVYPGQLNTLFKYQGISFYPDDNLSSASSVDQLVSSLYSDLNRQKGYLASDKADATASGLNEAIYEWGPNGYLTQGGVPTSVIDAFRADPRSKQWVIDEYSAIKSLLGPNDLSMEFTAVGDYWSTQLNPRSPWEYEQQGIAAVAPVNSPEPIAFTLPAVAVATFMGRKRVRRKAA